MADRADTRLRRRVQPETVFDPNLIIRFKKITYESIHEANFSEAVARVMPKTTVEKLFRE
jgi:hypothetical protein